MDNSILDFDIPRDNLKIIKVIGVGGGGGNAVTHMYREGIHDVSFLLCNTDRQALDRSEVPDQLVLGETITQGLGAGNEPDVAERAAIESEEDIKKRLDDGTRMVFITAGMGGGTGTGAAPIIARFAKEMNILTVGIVTIPFAFEGRPKIIQALKGVEEIRQNVDALLVINNERLREIYADLSVPNAFAKADDTLTVAAKSIAEIITIPGEINLDFADVNTTMRNGGVALMSNGFGEGEGRVHTAISDALNSPLLNNNDVFSAKKILLNVSYSKDANLRMEEMDDVHKFMSRFNPNIRVIWGLSIDNTLGNKVKITILATGFGADDIPEMDKLHLDRSKRMTEEELRQKNELIRKEQEDSELLAKYGYSLDSGKDVHVSTSAKVVVLTLEELDNDELITLLEDNPTYNRNLKIISDTRARIAAKQYVSPETAVNPKKDGEPPASGSRIISFR